MNNTLRQRKIQILSRLIKESSITLPEVLLLLDEELENQQVTDYIVSDDSITCTNGSTWNSSCSYAKYDETPTL